MSSQLEYLVIGGGYAGLNAARALQRLEVRGDVLIADINAKPGGGWTKFYDNCALHAPHPTFGIAGFPFPIKDQFQLATKQQILEHFQNFVDQLPQNFKFRGSTWADDKNITRRKDGLFSVALQSTDGAVEHVLARHVIHAAGFNYRGHQKPAAEKGDVKELLANDLPHMIAKGQMDPSKHHIVVVGGGKTGMDVCKHVLQKAPGTEITLVTGRSKFFINRDTFISNRAVLGPTMLDFFLTTKDWDGTTENATELLHQQAKEGKLLWFGDELPKSTNLGILSIAEYKMIKAGTNIVTNQYYSHCIRKADGTTDIVLTSGSTINTTKDVLVFGARTSCHSLNAFTETAGHPIQPNGVLRCGTQLGFTGPTSYLLTLLYGRNLIHKVDFYDLPKPILGKIPPEFWALYGLRVVTGNAQVAEVLSREDLQSNTLAPLHMYSPFVKMLCMLRSMRGRAAVVERADKFLAKLPRQGRTVDAAITHEPKDQPGRAMSYARACTGALTAAAVSVGLVALHTSLAVQS